MGEEHERLLPDKAGSRNAAVEERGYFGRLVDKLRSAGEAVAGTANQELLGLWLYVCGTVFGSGMSLMAKLAGQRGVPVFQVVLFRSLFLVGLTTPRLVADRINPFASDRQLLLLLRGALGFCSISSLFWAVSLLPMAEATVLSFLAPVIAAALSPLVLHERPSRHVLLALPCCVLGVLLVARPAALFGGRGAAQGGGSGWGVTVGLIQAFFSASAKMCIRALSSGAAAGAAREPMAAIIFSMGAVSTLGSGIASVVLRAFVLPASLVTWALLLLNGLFGYYSQVALTAALQRAKAAPAIAMSYFSIVWSIVADTLVFHTPPSGLSLLGAAVICGAGLWLGWAEKRVKAAVAEGGGSQQQALQAQQQQEVALGEVGTGAGGKGGGYRPVGTGGEEAGRASPLGSGDSPIHVTATSLQRCSIGSDA